MTDITYSMIASFKSCQKKFKYSYVDLLRSKTTPQALALGSYVHELLDAFYTACMNKEDPVRAVALKTVECIDICPEDEIRELGNKMMKNYILNYADDWSKLKILAVEEEFCVPIPGVDANLRGKFDLVFEGTDGRIYLGEHKTTALSIEARKSNLELDEQCSYYMWALQKIMEEQGLGEKVAGVMYNILRKKSPRIPEPLKKGGLSKAKSIDTTYDVYLKAILDNGYNPDDYADMLAMLKERGNTFFGRELVTRSEAEMKQIEKDIIHSCKQISKEDYYVRNRHEGCARTCSYRDLCLAELRGGDTEYIINECFDKKDVVHPELEYENKEDD
jgi:hypothetical protein